MNVESKNGRFVFDMAYCEVLEGWKSSPEFRDEFTQLIAQQPHQAVCWETPPVHTGNLDQRFEFVLTPSPSLASARVNPSPFSEHFRKNREEVLIFPNLGGDALLVVPRPLAEERVYGHLAIFLRKAPQKQIHAFWEQLSKAISRRLKERPIWVSTAGLGVIWLHARVCDTPKYYRHAGYR